ncbi:amino acid synthesis family protein [Streptomyces deccanensis]|uniref:amino acid synthesis family protein n=1 Tax=Streptomyces deccanensis TaxID=424188 RepID=UPI001EFBA25C|nr:amino acid synthesis family protein [Streptomyces deccanensis]ULR47862.1 amino acid synthesis family protein [Streptomyces deccanensis]
MTLRIRKILTVREETRSEGGQDADRPLVKAAAIAVLSNPYAGRPYSDDLAAITDDNYELGRLLASTAAETLGLEVEGYGKASLVGADGEIEHGVAHKIGEFGKGVRDAVGGEAWISSVSKRCGPGVQVDVPLAHKDEVWVRSHYDAFTLFVPDAPLADEVAVIVAVSSRGRLNDRVGGMTVEDVRKQEKQ